MCAVNTESKPSLIKSVFTARCPRCRQGSLFTYPNPYHLSTTMRMPEHCPVCGQQYELQTGFFFGTGLVSYALSVMVLAIIFTAWAMLIGFSIRDNSVFWCLGISTGFLVAIQPLLQRLARSIWITFFVRYDKNWRNRILV